MFDMYLNKRRSLVSPTYDNEITVLPGSLAVSAGKRQSTRIYGYAYG